MTALTNRVAMLAAHKEWAPGRKDDPLHDMNWRRRRVAAQLADPHRRLGGGAPHDDGEDDMDLTDPLYAPPWTKTAKNPKGTMWSWGSVLASIHQLLFDLTTRPVPTPDDIAEAVVEALVNTPENLSEETIRKVAEAVHAVLPAPPALPPVPPLPGGPS